MLLFTLLVITHCSGHLSGRWKTDWCECVSLSACGSVVVYVYAYVSCVYIYIVSVRLMTLDVMTRDDPGRDDA